MPSFKPHFLFVPNQPSKALKRNPTHWFSLELRARLNYEEGNWAACHQAVGCLLRADPTHPVGLELKACLGTDPGRFVTWKASELENSADTTMDKESQSSDPIQPRLTWESLFHQLMERYQMGSSDTVSLAEIEERGSPPPLCFVCQSHEVSRVRLLHRRLHTGQSHPWVRVDSCGMPRLMYAHSLSAGDQPTLPVFRLRWKLPPVVSSVTRAALSTVYTRRGR